MSGTINDKISYTGTGTFTNTLLQITVLPGINRTGMTRLGLKYNLRDKIHSSMELTGIGSRKLVVINGDFFKVPPVYKFEDACSC